MSSGTVTIIPARRVPEGMSLAAILRGLAKQGQAGWPRKPVDFYITAGDYWNRRHHGSLYVAGVGFCDLTDEQWRRVCALSERYRAYHRYRTEVAPGWRDEGGPIYWMDNSIEQPQRCAKGCCTRNVSVRGPGGDACY